MAHPRTTSPLAVVPFCDGIPIRMRRAMSPESLRRTPKPCFDRATPANVTSVQLDVDLAPGSYQWRVDVYNAAGQVIWCSFPTHRFVVEPRDARAVTPRAERPGDR